MRSRMRTAVATALITTVLGVGAIPTRADAGAIGVRIGHRVGGDAGEEIGERVAIGVGITTGVLAIVGGALWYYFRHRRQDVPAPAPINPAPEQ